MQKISINQLRILILLLVSTLSFMAWYSYFTPRINSDRPQEKQYIDKLSGKKVSTVGVSTGNGVNPDMPYFIGFDYLTKYGVTNDDLRYIQDYLMNFTLYTKNKRFAKISYVNGSHQTGEPSGTTSNYSFKIGINDTDIYEIKVASDIVNETISISIYNSSGKSISTKKFDIYTLN